jgi:hypothetical protein
MNADRRRRFGADGRTMALLCECGDGDCHRTVVLTADEYDARRPGPILHPEHLMPVDASSQPPPGVEIPPA